MCIGVRHDIKGHLKADKTIVMCVLGSQESLHPKHKEAVIWTQIQQAEWVLVQ